MYLDTIYILYLYILNININININIIKMIITKKKYSFRKTKSMRNVMQVGGRNSAKYFIKHTPKMFRHDVTVKDLKNHMKVVKTQAANTNYKGAYKPKQNLSKNGYKTQKTKIYQEYMNRILENPARIFQATNYERINYGYFPKQQQQSIAPQVKPIYYINPEKKPVLNTVIKPVQNPVKIQPNVNLSTEYAVASLPVNSPYSYTNFKL